MAVQVDTQIGSDADQAVPGATDPIVFVVEAVRPYEFERVTLVS